MRSLAVGVFVAVTLGGCAPRFERPSVQAALPSVELGAQPSAAPPPVGNVRSVELEYELAGQPFPSPLLRATIGGRSTWLVVDTGTSYHALSGWLANELALPITSTNTGKDHVGRDIRIGVIERATIAAGDWGMLVDDPLLVADVPEPFHQLNLGGFLSPQFLAHGDGRVLLDLQRSEMRIVSPSAADRLLAGRGGRFPTGESRICSATESVPYKTFVVPAYVEGELVQLLVDTGAERSNLRIASPAGSKLVARANGDQQRVYGAGGAFNALLIDDARVQIGEVGATADIELVPGAANPDCPSDGVLGMDILRSCVLAFGDGPITGRCSEDAN